RRGAWRRDAGGGGGGVAAIGDCARGGAGAAARTRAGTRARARTRARAGVCDAAVRGARCARCRFSHARSLDHLPPRLGARMIRSAIALRILAIALVAASPFAPPRRPPGKATSVVYVVDASSSLTSDAKAEASHFVQDAWKSSGTRAVGVVAFAARAEVLMP